MDNNMVPDKATREEIFGIVKALSQSEVKIRWAEFKGVVSSLPFLDFWLTWILFFIVTGGVYFIDRFGGNILVSSITGFLILILIPLLIRTLWKIARPIVKATVEIANHVTNYAIEQAERDAQCVNDFYKYESQDLKYVLVQLKMTRAAWERNVGLFAGALEKIGLIPSFIALVAILIRSEIAKFPTRWIIWVTGGVVSFYCISFVHNYKMVKLDRTIMLIEMVIEAKEAKEAEQPSQDTLDTTAPVHLIEPRKIPSKYCAEYLY